MFKERIDMKFRIPASNLKGGGCGEDVEEIPAMIIGRGADTEIFTRASPIANMTRKPHQRPAVRLQYIFPGDLLVIHITRTLACASLLNRSVFLSVRKRSDNWRHIERTGERQENLAFCGGDGLNGCNLPLHDDIGFSTGMNATTRRGNDQQPAFPTSFDQRFVM